MRIWGINPVIELLREKPENVKWIKLFNTDGRRQEIYKLAKEKGISIENEKNKYKLRDLALGDEHHQGVVADAPNSITYLSWKKFIDEEKIVFIPKIQDPQNFGNIVRSGVFFGIRNFFFTKKGLNTITSSIVKTSAGAVFKARFCNYTTAAIISSLKEHGFKVVLAGKVEGKVTKKLKDIDFDSKTIILFGNERGQLPSSYEKLVDECFWINGEFDSLNLSSIASIVFYTVGGENE